MAKKSAFTYNAFGNNGTSDISSPFWVKPKSNISKAKSLLKVIWKWAKIFILLFFFVMGLWGCFQSSFDSSIASSSNIGSGLEFGFNFGETGDWRYDLCGSSMQQYHTFNEWTMAYGPFYAWFIWPGAWLTMQICWASSNAWGGLNALLSIFVLILIIRLLTIAVTIKSTIQNEKMSEINGKLSEINAKYKGLKDAQSKQMKQQETMELYRKNHVHPFSAFEQILITLPIFLIVYRVVIILRPLKATVLFNIWNFSLSPSSEVVNNFVNGGWTYMFFVLIVVPVQFLSTFLPQFWAKRRNRNATAISLKGNKETKKKMLIQYGITGVMALVVIFLPTGVGIYWFFNACFSILQSYCMPLLIIHQRKKKNEISYRIGDIKIE